MSNILFKSDIADTLDYNRSDMALSARQGRALKQMLASLKKDMMLEAHPVGSLYWSMEATNPGDLFGGTWEQIKDKFIWATDSSPGSTGGSKTATLSVDNLPSHNHSIPSHNHSIPSHNHSIPSHTHSYTKATEVKATTLTQNQMPAHIHDSLEANSSGSEGSGWHYSMAKEQSVWSNGSNGSKGGSASHTHGLSTSSANTGSSSGTTGNTSGTTGNTSGTTGSAGSGSAFRIMPPYIQAYCWKRTA